MHFRIGAIAIPYLIDLLLQLEDEGELSLDDPVSNWLPGLPNADRVTLRMLANSTSGYPDWLQGNPAFSEALLADIFRQWKTQELVDTAFSQPLICDPGTCFHYAHTNYVIIDRVIREITGRPVRSLMRERVLRPLGARETGISAFPGIAAPVLHSYSSDRGPYEDSTFWSPSWTLPKSTIMTSTIGDLIKAGKALGTGALISSRASRERFAPTTVGLGPFSEDFYFGLGVVVANSWQLQNPELNGYTAIAGYLPSRKMSLALTVTNGEDAAAAGVNYSQKLFESITEYLTPDHPGAPPLRLR
jgi:CubicO group peptidase (beta-lactamase class C family)